MAVEALSIDQARRLIVDFPRLSTVSVLVDAVREVILAKTHLDIEVPRPSSQAVIAVQEAAQKGIYPLHLVYLPGYDSRYRYPSKFIHRLSSEALSVLNAKSLSVERGWRIFDAHQTREGDNDFLAPVIAAARESGHVLTLIDVPIDSRQALTPGEINCEIAPRVDRLLNLPSGTMGLPTLREAMMLGEIYGLVPVDVTEWQIAQLIGLAAKSYYPAGLKHSHDAHWSNAQFYNVRTKHWHRGDHDIRFRLVGKLPTA